MTETRDDVVFTIDSRLLQELGENLVTRNHVALGELIKNAYDADATETIVSFQNARAEDTSNSEIIVEDDGVGMSFEEVRDDFMRIATTDKLRNPTTEKYGRQKVGDKGIGRFACRRLAHILDLTTTTYLEDEAEYQRTSLEIDWRRYEQDQEIEEVTFEPTVETFDSGADVEEGTTIRLQDLQDSWTQRDFNTLRRNIITLTFGFAEGGKKNDPGFEIELDAGEFDKGEGMLSEQVHEASWGCMEGTISSQGDVSIELDAKLIGERSYDFDFDINGLDGTSFKISYVPLDSKEDYRDPQTLSVGQARDLADNHGGVRVYKGGFRVFSYGGPENDWLDIDRQTTTHKQRSPSDQFDDLSGKLTTDQEWEKVLLSSPNNRNLIGRVMIPAEADLTMQSNREGFIDEEIFDSLKNILRLSIEWMTLQWSHYKNEKKKAELNKQAKDFQSKLSDQDSSDSDTSDGEDGDADNVDSSDTTEGEYVSDEETVDEAMNLIENVAETATETVPEESRDVSNEAVESATKVIRSSIERKEEQIDFFRSAFSVNQVVFSFSHELRGMVNDLETSATGLEAMVDDLPVDQRPAIEEIITDLRKMQDRFEDQMELFGIFMETENRKEVEEVKIKNVVDDVIEATNYIADYYGTDVSADIDSLLLTPPMYESELHSIIINLVTNSIKATGAVDRDGQVQIEAKSDDGKVLIRVCDNGIGIPEEKQKEVFDPLVSDPTGAIYNELSEEMPDGISDKVGKGTGLGLNIVRNIAQSHGGDARIVDSDEWSTCVEVVLND
jgi:signal transduction histidine kinase